ncbi:hypothetical protein [Paeniglutamicibacter kerguelensis]|uniref:Uncharacterized protein n=1 Tax=Paeniglutamicibacter kerguelensis TaxID=254788 RepID=A0ABS4XF71_9MICC|nr:hypothetical protein [Paeniglutamicibacter kerguelensis]MBP2386334.1 hypothetical protein [Paeniglutamicibacter kerguelensis]
MKGHTISTAYKYQDMTVCGACAVELLLEIPVFDKWLDTSGVDINEAITESDRYLRIIRRETAGVQEFPVTRAPYPEKPIMCDKCLSSFEYDPNNPALDKAAYEELGLARGWEARHAEAIEDPSDIERHHIEMCNASKILAWLYVDLLDTYGDDAEAVPVIANVKKALEHAISAGIQALKGDKERLNGGTLDEFYRTQANIAGLDHTNL